MSKKPSNLDLVALSERAADLTVDLAAMERDIRKAVGYAEDVVTPAELAKSFAGLGSAASGLAAAILMIMANEEYRAALTAKLREQP